MIPSYPKIWNLGHPRVHTLFDKPVLVQEKIDGSQFSFMVKNGELLMKSKGAPVYRETTDGLFKKTVETVAGLFDEGKLVEGWIYRGEAMCKPKHNALAYERVPNGNIILFDIESSPDNRQMFDTLEENADYLGLELVPDIGFLTVDSKEFIDEQMKRTSCLGGPIEGLVFKSYDLFDIDGKPLMGKFVSQQYREIQGKSWKESNPSFKGDVIQGLAEELRTEARWLKAMYRFRDDGKLTGSVKDIGPLIGEISRDVLEESEEYVKETLWNYAKKVIGRKSSAGFAEWYKQRLAEQQFADSPEVPIDSVQ